MNPISEESKFGLGTAQLTVGLPAVTASIPPLFCRSTPEQIHPLRTIDVLGVEDFFNHSGNCMNGSLGAVILITACAVIEKRVPENRRTIAILGTAGIAVVGSVGVNIAYESGVHIPPYPEKTDDKFDGQDALFGGLTGLLFSVVYATAALRKRFTTSSASHRTP